MPGTDRRVVPGSVHRSTAPAVGNGAPLVSLRCVHGWSVTPLVPELGGVRLNHSATGALVMKALAFFSERGKVRLV